MYRDFRNPVLDQKEIWYARAQSGQLSLPDPKCTSIHKSGDDKPDRPILPVYGAMPSVYGRASKLGVFRGCDSSCLLPNLRGADSGNKKVPD